MNTPATHMTRDDWEAYVAAAAQAIALPIPADAVDGVVATLMTTAGVARPLLEWDVPEGTEIAPTFTSQ